MPMGAHRGGARVGRRPPPGKSGSFWLYWEPFCSFFFIWGPFCYVFLIMGGLFHHVGAFLLLFTPWWVPFLCLPPPPRTKISTSTYAHALSVGTLDTRYFGTFWTTAIPLGAYTFQCKIFIVAQ